jgi:hypothetical protein
LFLLTLSGLVSWVVIAHKNYNDYVKPGQVYQVGNRQYKVPDLPLDGHPRFLKPEFLLKQKQLLQTSVNFFSKK